MSVEMIGSVRLFSKVIDAGGCGFDVPNQKNWKSRDVPHTDDLRHPVDHLRDRRGGQRECFGAACAATGIKVAAAATAIAAVPT